MIVKLINIDRVEGSFTKFAQVNAVAMSRAMNAGNRAGRTKVISAKHGIRKEWKGITTFDVKRYTWSSNATTNKLNTRFGVTSKPINLKDFGAEQKKKGVSYKLKTKRRTMQGSFIAKGFVFTRKTKKANSIVPHFSITPTSMFIGAKGDEMYVETYFETFNTRYFQQLDYLMKK